jgi:hypothetical protein
MTAMLTKLKTAFLVLLMGVLLLVWSVMLPATGLLYLLGVLH